MSVFAKKLSQALAERQLSQTELAKGIGKGKSSISQYLSGRSIPRLDVQEKIANFLECSVEWLNEETSDNAEIGLRNVSVSDTARLLGKSEQFVRVGLQTGKAPFGFAVKSKSKWSYHISPKKLSEYMQV